MASLKLELIQLSEVTKRSLKELKVQSFFLKAILVSLLFNLLVLLYLCTR
jgi:hypothetical protein